MSKDYDDVDGVNFVVGKAKERGTGGNYVTLDEDEIYEAKFVGVRKEKLQFGPVLKWSFELIGENFAYETEEGDARQQRVEGTSSTLCNPKTKMYAWYCKLLGGQLEEGDAMDWDEIKGKTCRLVIKNTRGKKRNEDTGKFTVFSNVEKILVSDEEASEKPVKKVEKKKKVVKEEKVKEEKVVVEEVNNKSVKKSEKADEELFEDIF